MVLSMSDRRVKVIVGVALAMVDSSDPYAERVNAARELLVSAIACLDEMASEGSDR
jgi:hypothetical protein